MGAVEIKQETHDQIIENSNKVVIMDIKMDVTSMTIFIVKWGLASLLAAIVLVPIYFIVWSLFAQSIWWRWL